MAKKENTDAAVLSAGEQEKEKTAPKKTGTAKPKKSAEEKDILLPTCHRVGYNPYKEIMLLNGDTPDDPKIPYLPVSGRIRWFATYCEEHKLNHSIQTEMVSELTAKSFLTMKATVRMGESIFTGYGSRLINAGEGYSGDDVETAETRAIGRALRNAGFCSPFGDGDIEDKPVDGAGPQDIKNKRVASVLAEMTDEPAAEPETAPVPLHVRIADALKIAYPFQPWQNTPLYKLLEQPSLKDNLGWLVNKYQGNERIKNWARFVSKYIFATDDTDKKFYLAARKILKEQELLK